MSSHWAIKRVKNKARIIDTAMQLFAERGFEATTVEDIAEVTGVSRRSIYRYFGNKEGIFSYRQGELLEGFKSLISDPEPEETPYQTIRRACLRLAEVFGQDREMMVVQFRISRAASVASIDAQNMLEWEEAMVLALRRGKPKASHEEVAMAGAIMGMIRAVLRSWVDGGAEDDLIELGEQAFAALETGFKVIRGQGVPHLKQVPPPSGVADEERKLK